VRPLTLGLLAAVLAQAAAAPPSPRYERPILVAAPGPQRLAVDVALLAGGAPFTVARRGASRQRHVAEGGLSDLRLAGADGREVPYLLVHPPVAEPEWLPAGVEPIAATRKTSGFEADLGSVREIGAIDLRQLEGPFMKRFSLEASADRRRWTLVVPEGTLFDVPDRQIRQTEASFTAAPYRYLRVTWDDTNSARVPQPSRVFVRLVSAVSGPPPLTAPLMFARRPSEPGRSRYHVTLPGSRLPLVALRLDAGGTHVFRSVTVTEPRLSAWQAAPVTIGQGFLVRDQAQGALRVPLDPPTRTEIDVLVEDGDNPPLDLRAISAEFAELPWIYVDAPGPLVARYGDATLSRPSYDLEAARPSLKIETLPEARWGASPEPRAAAAPPADVPALGGAPLDVSPFRYSRDVAAGPPGLVALPLDAAILAHSAGPAREFADVRIVDAGGRQVPRLVERRPEPLLVQLRAEPATPTAAELQPAAGRNQSVYHLALPYAGLPEARIVISSPARVFQRSVRIGYQRPADRRHRDPWFQQIGAAEWSRTQESPVELTLPLGSATADATQLTLVVDEGDNSALPISNVQLLLPSYRLRFVRPASASRLVYGSERADGPRYDLALLAPAVFAAAVSDVTMTPERETQAAAAEQLISPRAFWVILTAAVLALLGVLVALLRKAT
jgi:hypothetical protein